MSSDDTVRAFLPAANPPSLGPGPRAGVTPLSELRPSLDEALAEARMVGDRLNLVRALVFLWHDHLDEAHTLAQDVPDRDGSYVHAIMHRREPDYGNAKYWFHRVGTHPCYSRLAARASERLGTVTTHPELIAMVTGGRWDAFAFVDACEAARRSGDAGLDGALRGIQQIEFETLLEHLTTGPP